MIVTHWNRVELERRNRDLTEAVQAQVQDPLWALFRQWQMGEFQGEDAGSPIRVEVEHSHGELSRFATGELAPGDIAQGNHLSIEGQPLETVVESGANASASPTLRFRVEAGQHFLRSLTDRLGSQVGEEYRQLYVTPEPAGRELAVPPGTSPAKGRRNIRFERLVTGKALDGWELFQRFLRDLSDELPPELLREVADQNEHDAVVKVAQQWMKWYESFFSLDGPGDEAAWDSRRLEHIFSVSAPAPDGTETVLHSHHETGKLDWYSFDQLPDTTLGVTASHTTPPLHSVTPTSVRFPGMPNPRWWEFEDREVNFPQLDVSNLDLGRLIVLDFALTYGNDWFLIPLTLPVGSCSHIERLTVFDTFDFGQPYSATTAGQIVDAVEQLDPSWRMYRIVPPAGVSAPLEADFLFLAPALVKSLESKPVEEVRLIRDEVANLGWGIEVRVPGAGFGVEREEQWRESLVAPTPPSGPQEDVFDYQLMSEVPNHWYPLVPQRDTTGQVELLRGLMRQSPSDIQAPPEGEFLREMSLTKVPEEEVPRAGANLLQTHQVARGIDGNIYLWRGRKRQVGRGEGASHLQYDDLS